MTSWLGRLFGGGSPEPDGLLLPQTDRFLPAGKPQGFRGFHTAAAVDPHTGEKVFRSGSGVSLTSQDEADRFAQENANRNLEAALAEGPCSAASYAYAVDRQIEPLVESLAGLDGKTAAHITINSYGALVMNASSLLFADVDTTSDGEPGADAKADETAAVNLRVALERNPSLSFRVYRTRNGWRYLCTNRTFDPTSEETRTLLKALGSDEKYIVLCRVQRCFRARLTPKPWRTGQFTPSINLARGVPRRVLATYLRKADGYSTTQFVTTTGSDKQPSLELAGLIDYHDRWSRAATQKPLA